MTNLLIVTPIFPPDIGGPATYVSNLIKKLPKNINSQVITFAPASYSKKNITAISTKQNSLLRQFNLFFQILKKSKTSDLIYLQGTLTSGLSTLLASKLTNKPYILKYVGDEVWENFQNIEAPRHKKCRGNYKINSFKFAEAEKNTKVHESKKNNLLLKRINGKLTLEKYLSQRKNNWQIKLQRLILTNAQNIIVPSKYLQLILKKYYQVNSIIIPNSIEIPEIKIKKSKNSIIYVGRLTKYKNVDRLIQAFSKLSKNYKLNIVGEGPEKNNLNKIAKKLNLNNQTKFCGQQNKKKTSELISKSEYLVLLSDYEGLSHTLLEAMSLKCKIITSNIKANSDLLSNGEYGILVNHNNQQEIISAFTKKYSKTKIEKARRFVSTNFFWQNHIDKLIDIIC